MASTWNVVVGNYSLARNKTGKDHRVVRSTPHADPIAALLDLEHAIIKGEAQEIGRGGTYRIEIDGNAYSLHQAARKAIYGLPVDIKPHDDGWMINRRGDNDHYETAPNAAHAVILARRMAEIASNPSNFPPAIETKVWPRIVNSRGEVIRPEWSYAVLAHGRVVNGNFGFTEQAAAQAEADERARKHVRA